ncbi:MAG: SGNH/GDSL hydrolase family protein [Pirellulaceae bacterium]|nr:SGNH/GDSL hydrolase family protein [Pirellulaceae bacterium]
MKRLRYPHGCPISGLAAMLLVVVIGLTSSRRGSAQSFSHLVAFGDSLTDTGNIFDVTSSPFNAVLLGFLFPELDPPIPPPPYFHGRFSNGPVWVEYLSNELGLGSVVPSEQGGWNYAVGGATTFDDGNFFINLFIADDVEDQVDEYLNDHTPTGNELFVVEGGANDLLSGGITDVTVPSGYLIDFISDLYQAGGRHFVVPNLPPLGKIPGEVGGPDEAVLDIRAVNFNAVLASGLDNLERSLTGIEIYPVDFYAEVQSVLANPGAFGFTNVSQMAYDEGTNQVVPNPDEYLFWDDIHPSAFAHELLGLLAAAAVLPAEVCDFDGGTTCDADDLEMMYGQGNLVTGVSVAENNPFDLNSDLLIDQIDLNLWLSEAATVNGYASPYQRGDADGIGSQFPAQRAVDITDFNLLVGNFDPSSINAVTNTWEVGNFDGDTDIDITDFNFVASHFAPTGYISPAPVPEPHSWGICIAAAIVLSMGLRANT